MARDRTSGEDQWVLAPEGSTVIVVVSRGPAPVSSAQVTVPGVVGEPQSDALAKVQRLGLNAQVFVQPSDAHARGKVLAQWPHPGEAATDGSTVALLVSTGAPPAGAVLTSVPSVIGHTEADAHARLEQARLRSHVMAAYSSTVPAGVVFGQLPEEHAVPTSSKRTSPWLFVGLAAAALVIVIALILAFGRGGSGDELVAVPNVVGMSQAEAGRVLEEKGLTSGEVKEQQVEETEPGTVLSQDPAVGKHVTRGSAVNLVVSGAGVLAKVPEVAGRTQETAEKLLREAQLEPSVTEAPSNSVPAGTIVSQTPTQGQLVPIGTVVGIVVSIGPKNVSVPDLVGLTVPAAEKALADAGLKAEVIENFSETVPAGTVVSQAPPPDASVAQGTPVAILVSKGPQPSEGETTEVPRVVGKSLGAATEILEDIGFTVSSLKVDGTGKPADEVVYQTPAAGETAPLDSEVALIISSGK